MANSEGNSSTAGAGGYWDEFLNSDDSFYKIMNVLDFPMESVEGNTCFDLEKRNAQFQSLGPLTSEFLHGVAPVVTSDGMTNSSVQIDPPSNRKHLGVVTETSYSSVLKNICAGHSELLVPVRTRTKIPKASTFTNWRDQHMPGRRCSHCQAERTPLWREGPLGPKTLCNACGIQYGFGRLVPEYHPSTTRDSGNAEIPMNTEKKKKSSHKTKMPRGPRQCVQCHVTKTPQWRGGPMGPGTLCNACGVRYRCGRLKYHPAAGSTSVTTLHSNNHN